VTYQQLLTYQQLVTYQLLQHPWGSQHISACLQHSVNTVFDFYFCHHRSRGSSVSAVTGGSGFQFHFRISRPVPGPIQPPIRRLIWTHLLGKSGLSGRLAAHLCLEQSVRMNGAMPVCLHDVCSNYFSSPSVTCPSVFIHQQLNSPRWALASSVVFCHSSLSWVLHQFLTPALARLSVMSSHLSLGRSTFL
jgi:hypothetical protein